jgi:hypothetical protein
LCQRLLPGEAAPYSILRYGVLRVWELPPGQLLSGGLGLLPLAPVSNVTEDEVLPVLRRVYERLEGLEQADQAADIWTSASLLMGLRYSEEFLAMVSEAIQREFEHSPLGRIMERRARLDEGRKFLLMIGEERFGPADVIVRAAISALSSTRELERLGKRAFHVSSWQELFTPPDDKAQPPSPPSP